MEALRFPWGDNERRREVAPSTFRPRSGRKAATRNHATRPSRSSASKASPSVTRSVAIGARGMSGPRTAQPQASRPTTGPDRAVGRVVDVPRPPVHEPDYVLLVAALALSAIGMLMIFSSQGVSDGIAGNLFDALTEQLGWGLLGGLALIVVMRIDYRYWRSFAIVGMIAAFVLLVLILGPSIPPLLDPIRDNGATRWMRIGGLPQFQPTEVAKLALVLFLAHWLSKRGARVGSFRAGTVPFILLLGALAGLVLLEPDLGTTGVLALSALAMFFVAGGSRLQLAAMVPLGLAGVSFVVMNSSYMRTRIELWANPFQDRADAGYQSSQALYSLAWGGITGRGLGITQQDGGLHVPAAQNDFIFAVIGQEFGLIGGLIVVGLFLLLAWRGVRVAMNAPDTFGQLLALGITSWLTFQALINIGVVVNLFPMTGMPLPFLSKGGTSLVVALIAVGMLLSISRESDSRGSSLHEDAHRGRGHRRPHLSRSGRGDPAADAIA
jgi:cell division protein FtsW